MISIIVFPLVVMAGSIFAGVFFRRKFGETIPCSMMGIILLLYLCGGFGFLKAGVYVVLSAAGALLVLSVGRLVREKRFGGWIRGEFGWESQFFLLIYAVLVILNSGRVAWYTDEISHWMDCVKAMSQIDDFAANAVLSHSLFPSYPPGMALFQYFFQKLHEILDGTAVFCEWRPYVAFQLFAFALFFPCLGKLKYYKLAKPVLFGCAMLVPLVMYPGFFFSSVLIDPMIGVMAGAGFVYLLMDDGRRFSDKAVYISMLCALLVLMKDAGLFFAVFLGVAFIPYAFLEGKRENTAEKKTGKAGQILTAFVPLLSALAAKGSWTLILNRFQTPRSFAAPLQIGDYLRLFFAGGGSGWQQETVNRFKEAFADSSGFQIHNGISVSYLLIVLALFLALALLTVLLVRKAGENGEKGKAGKTVLLGGMLALQTVIYLFFLGAVYISKFGEQEALALASYERYIRMAVLPLALMVVWAAFYWLQTKEKLWKTVPAFVLSALILLLCPMQETKSFVTREMVKESEERRAPYREVQEAAENLFGPGDRIFYTTDGSDDPDTVQFVIRPYVFAGSGTIPEQEHLETYDYLIEGCEGQVRWTRLH